MRHNLHKFPLCPVCGEAPRSHFSWNCCQNKDCCLYREWFTDSDWEAGKYPDVIRPKEKSYGGNGRGPSIDYSQLMHYTFLMEAIGVDYGQYRTLMARGILDLKTETHSKGMRFFKKAQADAWIDNYLENGGYDFG